MNYSANFTSMVCNLDFNINFTQLKVTPIGQKYND